ncbi:PTS sugar transporter subunit IIC [candidate division KSB1 bacterium]|nr:PTS sugar transporter subunit IIC [candidate division KSB1 bacterium]
MWLKFLALSMWGGIVSLDTTAAMQMMISRPLVSCSVVGLLLGNFPLGFSVGILLELIWLIEIPYGAVWFSEGNVGATVASAIAIFLTKQSGRTAPAVYIALILAVLVSIAGGWLVVTMRDINGRIYQSLLDDSNLTFKKITRAHFTGVLMAFSIGFLLTAAMTLTFALITPFIMSSIPQSADKLLQPIQGAFMGTSCGILIHLFIKQKRWWLLLLGFSAGFVLVFTK